MFLGPSLVVVEHTRVYHPSILIRKKEEVIESTFRGDNFIHTHIRFSAILIKVTILEIIKFNNDSF